MHGLPAWLQAQVLLGLADLAKGVRIGYAKALGTLHSPREKAENPGPVSFQAWGRLVLYKTEVAQPSRSCLPVSVTLDTEALRGSPVCIHHLRVPLSSEGLLHQDSSILILEASFYPCEVR